MLYSSAVLLTECLHGFLLILMCTACQGGWGVVSLPKRQPDLCPLDHALAVLQEDQEEVGGACVGSQRVRIGRVCAGMEAAVRAMFG